MSRAQTLRRCPGPGPCQQRVPARLLGCRPHWRTVSPPARSRVWSTWRARQRRPGDPQAMLAHQHAIRDAIGEMHRAAQEPRR
jgi:hypothetical protein